MGYERTPVKTEGYTLSDLRKKFNCGQATAVRIRKDGYICKKVKFQNPGDMDKFDTILAYKAAEVVFWRKFRYMFDNSLDHFDDMKQMAVLRMVECSGSIDESMNNGNPFYFFTKIATNEMYNYLKTMHIIGSAFSGKMESFDKNVAGSGLYAIA